MGSWAVTVVPTLEREKNCIYLDYGISAEPVESHLYTKILRIEFGHDGIQFNIGLFHKNTSPKKKG